MDKIEKIRQEIERRKESLRAGICGRAFTRKQKNEMLVASEELDRLNRFLSTLEPEEPDKSLEEEIKDYFQGYWPGTDTAEQCNTDLHFTPPAIMRLARHFAKWQKEQMMEEAVETELYWDGDFLAIDLNMAELGYSERDKVRLIVLPKKD